jgi:hypothetical protein
MPSPRPRAWLAAAAALAAVVLGGCASIGSLPRAPADVVLEPRRFEQGYWPRYTASTVLQGVTRERALAAARHALREDGFTIVRDDPQALVVMGQRGATLFYWNVVAGVYLVERGADIQVSVVSVGSKDIGFIEVWPNPFPRSLVQRMEQALQAR